MYFPFGSADSECNLPGRKPHRRYRPHPRVVAIVGWDGPAAGEAEEAHRLPAPAASAGRATTL
jgi:hypothetical protein